MRIAVVGAGEVGRTYAAAALEVAGVEVMLNDPDAPPAATELAQRHGIVLHRAPGPWLLEADRIWLCVTGDLAHLVVESLLPQTAPETLLVDLSTATPEDKRASAAAADQAGVRYVDAVIMGAVGLTGARTPLLAAGPYAQEALADLAALGAPVRALPVAAPGDVAALKLLRTVLTKGLEALAIECLTAAEQQGVRAELYEVLSDIDEAGVASFMNAVVRTHVLHAERRRLEIQRAATQLERFGLPSLLMEASEQRFAHTAEMLASAPPEDGAAEHIDTAVAWLLRGRLKHSTQA